MNEIAMVKKEIRLAQWAEMVRNYHREREGRLLLLGVPYRSDNLSCQDQFQFRYR